MINYLLFTTLLAVLLAVYYCYLVRIYYMDLSLNQFRETQFRILSYMADNYKTAPINDLEKAKLILKGVDRTIQHFETAKSVPFSIVRAIINNAVFSGERLNKIETAKPDSLSEFTKMYAKGVSISIKSIPFVRIQIFTFLVKNLVKILIILGILKSHNYLKKFDEFVFAEHTYFDDHCIV